jgi:hypothetical protein
MTPWGSWHACAGGQRRVAERLLAADADLNWEPDYAHGTPQPPLASRRTLRTTYVPRTSADLSPGGTPSTLTHLHVGSEIEAHPDELPAHESLVPAAHDGKPAM